MEIPEDVIMAIIITMTGKNNKYLMECLKKYGVNHPHPTIANFYEMQEWERSAVVKLLTKVVAEA